MPVNSRHPDFDHHIADWTMLRDAIAGDRIVKEKDELYLPMPSGFKEQHDSGKAMYRDYKHRAQFPHLVEPTTRGMLGVIPQGSRHQAAQGAGKVLGEGHPGGAPLSTLY